MTPTTLIHHLGEVLMEAREEAGLSRERLAATDPEGVTTNTLFRFEKGTNARYWPRDPEAFVKLYADSIGVKPAILWLEAVTRYVGEQGDVLSIRPAPVARADVQRALARGREAAQALNRSQARPRRKPSQG